MAVTGTGCQFASRHRRGKVHVCLTLWQLQSRAHQCMFKGLTDKKLKGELLYVNVNNKNVIYYILFVFINRPTTNNYSPQLKL